MNPRSYAQDQRRRRRACRLDVERCEERTLLSSGLNPAELPLSVISESAVVEPAARDVAFTIVFNRAPDFTSIDAYGRQADSFQYFIDNQDKYDFSYSNFDVLVRGEEIHVAGALPVRDRAGDAGDPAAGGWGPVRATVPFTLIASTLTFSAPWDALGSSDGQFSYRLEWYEFGAARGFHTNSTVTPVNIDTTPPTTTATLSGPAGSRGWYVGPVTVTLIATDPDDAPAMLITTYRLDGAPTAYDPAHPIVISGDGVHTLTYHSRDPARNVEANQTQVIRIDQTPPTVTATAHPSALWPPNGKLVPVVVTGRITDMTSGVDLASATFAVTDEYGRVQPTSPVTVDSTDGTYSVKIWLEAQRNGGDWDGRDYTLTVSARDQAGNLRGAATHVIVPHDNG